MVSQISLFRAPQLMIDKNHQTCRTAVRVQVVTSPSVMAAVPVIRLAVHRPGG
jgi:hypothetical protein